MKLKFILFIIIPMIYFGCGDKKGKDAPATNSQENTNFQVGDKYILKMGYIVGEKYNYAMSSYQENVRTINDQTQGSKMTILYKVTAEVISKDSSGEVDMKMKFNSVKIDGDLGPQGKITFDSNNPADSAKKNMPAFMQFNVLIGNHYFVRLSSRGEVVEIYKIDIMLKKLFGPNPEKINENAKTQVRIGLESQLRSITQQIFQLLPEGPVKMDSSWYRIYDEKLDVLDIQNKAIYTLKSVSKINNKDIAHIEGTLTSEAIGKRNFENQGAKISYDKPEIKATGIADFDLGQGVVLKRDYSTTVSISMIVNQSGKQTKVSTKALNRVKIDLE
jgi:hypothetical protein